MIGSWICCMLEAELVERVFIKFLQVLKFIFLFFYSTLYFREKLVTSLPSSDAAVPKTLNYVRWTESQLFQKQSLSLWRKQSEVVNPTVFTLDWVKTEAVFESSPHWIMTSVNSFLVSLIWVVNRLHQRGHSLTCVRLLCGCFVGLPAGLHKKTWREDESQRRTELVNVWSGTTWRVDPVWHKVFLHMSMKQMFWSSMYLNIKSTSNSELYIYATYMLAHMYLL